MKKLLYVTNGINGVGGLERVLAIRTKILAEEFGYQIWILVLNEKHLNPFFPFSPAINFLSMNISERFPWNFMRYRSKLIQVVSELNPDIVIVCDDGFKGYLVPGMVGKKIPTICERHSSIQLNSDHSLMGRFKQRLMRSFARRFDAFVVLTTCNQHEWIAGNLHVVPNPLPFYPEQPSCLTERTVIVVGSHSMNKGYDLLLKAWQQVVARHPDWKLRVFGRFDPQQTFPRMANEMGISSTVYFSPPLEDIQQEYLNSSIFVLPSRTEGFGMVLIEAMACGLPCISFDCPSGPRDIIRNGEDGFLVEPENFQALADRICMLIADKGKREKMGAAGRINVLRYDPLAIARRWHSLYQEIPKKSGKK